MDEDLELARNYASFNLYNRDQNPPLLSLISSFLESKVEKNDNMLQESEETITIFHGSSPPSISIRNYVFRIFKYCGCTPSCLLLAVIYLDRFIQRTHCSLTSLNVHRLVLTSTIVAAKFIDNSYCNNAYYARVGGITNEELNELEISFLFTIDFRLLVDVQTFIDYFTMLEAEAKRLEP